MALTTGVSLDVLVGGPADAPPVIFLHGFPESSRTWRAQLEALGRDYRVVAPDQRGYASSDKPRGVINYRINALVADVTALADALGFERFALAGHDWGGAVAWAVALKHPERVSRLIIANGPHPHVFQARLFTDLKQRHASQYIVQHQQPAAAALIRRNGLEAFYDQDFARHFDGPVPPPEREKYLDEWSRDGALEAMLNWYAASPLVAPPPGRDVSPPDWLNRPFPKTRMPVLAIWGERDKALLVEQLEDLGDHVPDLTIVRLDTGHFVTWEAPEAVTRTIHEFLARSPRAA